MNELAPRPSSQPPHPFPHGLISLWDIMERFYASHFMQVMQNIATVQTSLRQWRDKRVIKADLLNSTFSPSMRMLRSMLVLLSMPVSERSAARIESVVEAGEPITKADFEPMLEELSSRIRDELEMRFLFSVDQHAEYLEAGSAPFGDDVAAAFRTAKYDIEEAGKCLALRRPVACVMHLMRALESCLSLAAAKLEVSFSNPNWATVLDLLEARIKRMSSLDGPSWKQDQQFYSEAAAHFRLVKDAWQCTSARRTRKTRQKKSS